MERFYCGAHQPSDGRFLGPVMMAVHRLKDRVSKWTAEPWMMDSGAFSEITTHGAYRQGVEPYAAEIRRWHRMGGLVAAVAQDYMCEDRALKRTGLTVHEHQRMTIERYDALWPLVSAYVMPVLQGREPDDYVAHLKWYGERLEDRAWVGVGSVCKRQGNPLALYKVLAAIKAARPDLRLHGFGVKVTALESKDIRTLLYTTDSLAWSDAARKEGRNANDWREAVVYTARVNALIALDRLRA